MRRAELEPGRVTARTGEGIASAPLTAKIPKCGAPGEQEREQPRPVRKQVRLRARISIDDGRRRRLHRRFRREAGGLASRWCRRREVEASSDCGRRGLAQRGRRLRCIACRPLRPSSNGAAFAGRRFCRLCRVGRSSRPSRLRRCRRRRLGAAGHRAIDREVAKLGGADGILRCGRRRRRNRNRRAFGSRAFILSQSGRSKSHRERNGRRTYTQC